VYIKKKKVGPTTLFFIPISFYPKCLKQLSFNMGLFTKSPEEKEIKRLEKGE